MIKIDLITGFLGSGKTTFLKKYVKYFTDQGQKIGILENDHGAVNVDMLLLQDMRSDMCELEMVAGGCDADCHRRRFKTKLIAMGMTGYDRVVVEPSGIFDVDEFFDALHEEPLDRWYEIGNVIDIVDGGLEEEQSRQADFYLASQAAHAGIILISKSDRYPLEKRQQVVAHLERAMSRIGCTKGAKDMILDKSWDLSDHLQHGEAEDVSDARRSKASVDYLNSQDMDRIASCGYRQASYIKYQFRTKFETLYFLNTPMDEECMILKTKALFADEVYGRVFRVKGFYQTGTEERLAKGAETEQEEGSLQWKQINATRHELTISPITVGQEVFIVIGEDLKEDVIRNFISN